MSSTAPAPADAPRGDRRAEAKAATRRAIVRAAAELMHETAGVAYPVDELAARAGVSRRTVFNHFASLDDVVAAVGADAFAIVVDALTASEPRRGVDPVADARADLGAALRASDLFAPLVALSRGMGLPVAGEAWSVVPTTESMLMLHVMHDVGETLVARLSERHPAADRLDLQLVVGTLLSGLVVIHARWALTTGASDDDESRRVWDALLDRLLHHLPALPPSTSHTETKGHHG